MHPTIATALVHEHHDDLLRRADRHRRIAAARGARDARTGRKPVAVAVRVSVRPFVLFQSWLAHGYL